MHAVKDMVLISGGVYCGLGTLQRLNSVKDMVLISGGVYCLMQWCRDTSEVKLDRRGVETKSLRMINTPSAIQHWGALSSQHLVPMT